MGRLYDKKGIEIELGKKIKDEDGEYIVVLGNFDKEDNSEIIADGINNGHRKLLWPERAKEFEIVKEVL